ncbi:MAG: CehA/McbA family metallohydrolase [Candidatus Hydrogenedentes bacterium]|nr:CehA/McbA family metallohydrolase [Candidatus Hydrogenedentota bacterium]
MRVEGEKIWRFRAEAAGVTVRLSGPNADTATLTKQTSCWQTAGWHPAWIVLDVPAGCDSIEASLGIVSAEHLPGRFRVRDVQLRDLQSDFPVPETEGSLRLQVLDEHRAPISARVYLINAAGEGIVPPSAYAYLQGVRCFEFLDPRLNQIPLPDGRYTVRAMKGFEYAFTETTVDVNANESSEAILTLKRQFDWSAKGWWSGDHHTHLYRHGSSLYPMMDLNDVYAIAQAEGLNFLPFQGVDKYLESKGEMNSPTFIARYTQELTRDFWGHICPVGMRGIPRPEESGSAWPMNGDYIEAVRSAGGAIAYAHPYGPLRRDDVAAALADPKAGLIAREWPIDVALGYSCTIDILAKEDARGEFDLKLRDYMRLLNLGFRCGVSGSTDFHLDQGREPIGGFRTYAHATELSWESIARAYNEGRTFATNGPLIDVHVDEASPGDTLSLDSPGQAQLKLQARSLWGIDRATVWMNGVATHVLKAEEGTVNITREIPITQSGWVLVIAEGRAAPEVMTSPEGKPCVPGQYAITSPIYIEVKNTPAPRDSEAAQYFADWCESVRRGFDALCEQHRDDGNGVPEKTKSKAIERIDQAKNLFLQRATG